MQGQLAKSKIDLDCTEQAFPEFPNLLFGTQIDLDASFFDATFYLQKQAPQKSIRDFFIQYKAQIEALCSVYQIPEEEICTVNAKGHYLIDGNLVYLFISFVEPSFLAYMSDRIHEIMVNGVALSDSYLIDSVKLRFNQETINALYEHETQGKQHE